MGIFTELIKALYFLCFENLGLTIIVLGLASRLVFLPSSIAMIRHQKKMQDLQPKLKELKRLHEDDKKRQMEEQAKLFREHGINPASGCLNAVLQIGIALILYNALSAILYDTSIKTQFFMWDLAKPDVIRGILGTLPLPGILVLISAVTQLVLSKMMAPAKPIVEDVTITTTKDKMKKEEKQDMADIAMQMQSQMLFLFPVMIIYSGYFLPAGLALYWAVTTLFAIAQQYLLVGFGGMSDWLPRKFAKAETRSAPASTPAPKRIKKKGR